MARGGTALSTLLWLAACGDDLPAADEAGEPTEPETAVALRRAFRADDLPGCTWASPILIEAAGERRVVVATTEGRVAAYDRDGAVRWSLELPAGDGERTRRRRWRGFAITPAGSP